MSEFFAVKAKATQYKHFMFVTPGGGLNRLRVHAAMFGSKEAAEKAVEMNTPKHPDWKWKVVPFYD